MSSWSHGYNVERGYTYNSFKEMSPEWLDCSALLNGYSTPDRSSGFRYLELGSGQGFGLCLLAAAYPDGEFVGIDFNPAHIAHSRQLVASTGLTNIRFIEGDFAELAASWPTDLGRFHYAALHGIYSWIPSAIRPMLARCLDHGTEPGALIYASYNAMPGWAASIPLQHMTRRLQVATASAGTESIKQAQKLFESMDAAGAAIFKAYPGLKSRLQSNKTQDPAYLVHEYLHDHWHPLWFSQVASEFAAAKLSYVGSATLAENFLSTMLPEATRKILAGIADPTLQQEVMDCAINQSFRRDVFCRGPRRLFGGTNPLLQRQVALIKHPGSEAVKIKTSFGEAGINTVIQNALVTGLADGPRSLQGLRDQPELKTLSVSSLAQTIALMMQGGYLMPVPAQPAAGATNFNRTIIKMAALEGAPYSYLAAPGLGNTVNLGWTDMVLLDAWLEHRKTEPEQLGADLTRGMARFNRNFLKDGKPIDTAEGKAEQLRSTVQLFIDKLPALQWQGVFD